MVHAWYRPILRTGYMGPMFSSFLLGAATQLQKSNLSAAERGLSANVTKFLLGRFYCHIADWPLGQGARISAALCCSPPRVYMYAAPQAAGRQAPSRTPVPSPPRLRRDCLRAEHTGWAVGDVSGAVGQAVLARGCCSTRIRGVQSPEVMSTTEKKDKYSDKVPI
jgi:hypothetical protein